LFINVLKEAGFFSLSIFKHRICHIKEHIMSIIVDITTSIFHRDSFVCLLLKLKSI